MVNPWLHRYTVFIAVCSALLFITGSVVSSSEERPLYSLGQCHAWLGAAVTVLVLGLMIWLSKAKNATWLRRLAWLAFGANLVQDLLALETGPIPPVIRVGHTLVGQLFFSSVVSIAVITSTSWNQNPKPIDRAPRLRFLTTTIFALVLMQVILGTAHRHGATGVLLHILGALVVSVFLGPAMVAILRTEHAELRSAAIALIMLTAIQLLLGFALLTMESFDDIDPLIVIIATTAHVAIGAFTLATAVVIPLMVRHTQTPPQ